MRLRAELADAGRSPARDDELESMIELMRRTEGVDSAAVAPLHGVGLAIGVDLSAPDAATAGERARVLATSSARYAHLGGIAIHDVRVAPRPGASR